MTNDKLSEAYAPLTTPDTNNATSIKWQNHPLSDYPLEGFPGETRKTRFKNLDLLNQGAYQWEWENHELVTYRLNEWGIRALASQVELRPWQADRAARHIHSLNLGEWGLSSRLMMFALCTYIVHSDDNDIRETYPTSKDRNRLFTEMQATLGLRDKDVIKTYQKLLLHFRTNRPSPTATFDRFDTDGYQPEWYQGKLIGGVVAGEPQRAPNGDSNWT